MIENGKYNSSLAVVMVAAGKGERVGGDLPKQYQLLAGKPMLWRSVEAMVRAAPEARIWVVVHSEHHALAQAACDGLPIAGLVDGGATRQESVFCALRCLAELDAPPQWVMVHDAARPMVDAVLVQRIWNAREAAACIVPAVAVVDTLKSVVGDVVTGTIDRAMVRAVQTPQLADFKLLYGAHARFEQLPCTDDAAIMEAAGYGVQWVEGSPHNFKVTTREDMMRAEQILVGERLPRVGMGYDVHPLEDHAADVAAEQRVIMLGGVAIPFEQKCKGHSDADVILHAVVDALLGALGAGDIGLHFPPSDMRWKGADSAIFMAESLRLLKERGGVIGNLDVTYIGEVPRIGAYRDAIRARIAQLLEVDVARVNVKATTTEKLGFEGRKEGVAAQAVVMLYV